MKLDDVYRRRFCANFLCADTVLLGGKVGHFHFDVVCKII